jgi:oligopeptide transport system permease protein
MANVQALPALEELDTIATRRARGLWTDAFRRLTRNRLAMVALVVLTTIITLSVLGNYVDAIQRYDPAFQNLARNEAGEYESVGQSPSWDHFLGTDHLGRDLWSRILQGTWISLRVGLGVAFVVLIIGVMVGGTAALTGSIGDNILMRLTDLAYAFPDLLFIILIRAVLFDRDLPIVGEQQLVLMIFAIAFVGWTTTARLVRGQMLSLSQRDYVIAAKTMGASQTRIVFQHMLPNALGPVIVAITFAIPLAIFAEAVLAFIGFGLEPPLASLGILIRDGNEKIIQYWWPLVFPGATIALLMLCFTFIGDGLRDALDPRGR